MKKSYKTKVRELKEKVRIYKKRIPEFKIHSYNHFDAPIQEQTEESVKKTYDFLNNPENIARHAFLPFISSVIIERRKSIIEHYKYYKDLLEHTEDEEIKTECRKRIDKFTTSGAKKERPIRIASHLDSLIYSHYALILRDLYEKKAAESGISEEVLAYRKPASLISRNGVDDIFITTAAMYDTIQEIRKRNNDCYVLAFDLSSFFDTIDHRKLKEEWIKILGKKELGRDEYNIYKSLTKYSYVKKSEINEYLEYVATHRQSDKQNSEPDKKHCEIPSFKEVFNSGKNFRRFREWYKNNPRYADHKCFHKNREAGIPQGIHISCILSNIYMLPFDLKMHQLSQEYNLFYRRYCDDILIILPRKTELRDIIIKEIKEAITDRGTAIKIHPINSWDKYSKSQCFDFGNKDEIQKKPLQYLGYCYDGKNVRIRESSIAKYKRTLSSYLIYYRIKQKLHLKYLSEHHQSYFLKIANNPKSKKELFYIRRRKLYEKFTFRGKINFITYGIKSSKVFYGSDSKSNSITSQIRSHTRIIKEKIDEVNNQLDRYINQLVKRIINSEQEEFLQSIAKMQNDPEWIEEMELQKQLADEFQNNPERIKVLEQQHEFATKNQDNEEKKLVTEINENPELHTEKQHIDTHEKNSDKSDL